MIYQTSKYPFTLPRLTVGPYCSLAPISGGNHSIPMIRVSETKTKEPLYIQTPEFHLPKGPIKMDKDGKNYVFALSTDECEGLFPMVDALETQLNTQLATIAPTIDNIPEPLRATLVGDKLLRPTYSDAGRAFFRMTPECTVFNWLGTARHDGKLECGNYQLILRLATIFLGSHAGSYPASLQFKVVQIRHRPTESESLDTSKFLFMSEHNGDWSVNNYPPNQMHAIELGLCDGGDEDSTTEAPPPSPILTADEEEVVAAALQPSAPPMKTGRKRRASSSVAGTKKKGKNQPLLPPPPSAPLSPMAAAVEEVLGSLVEWDDSILPK